MRVRSALLLLTVALAAGCSKEPVAADSGEPHVHHHHPPHGGTLVTLGEEEYHVELVLDDSAGKLQAFVFDGELENFVRSTSARIVIDTAVGGRRQELAMDAVPNAETGETVGDTSLFEASADWLKTTPKFEGVLREVTIRGTTYTNVKFNFPKENDAL
jgi:hypothetical protein